MKVPAFTSTLWLAIWLPVGIHAQPATSTSNNTGLVPAATDVAATAQAKEARDHAVDLSSRALAAYNSCMVGYGPCAARCYSAKVPLACVVAQCDPMCAAEENALNASKLEVDLRETAYLRTAQNENDNSDRAIKAAITTAPSASDDVAEAAHLGGGVMELAKHFGMEISPGWELGGELVGLGGLVLQALDTVPKVPATTSPALPPPYNPAWDSPLPAKDGRVAVPPPSGTRLDPSPKGFASFVSVNPGDAVIVSPGEITSPGTAVFRLGDRSGTSTFQAKTTDVMGTAVFSPGPKPDWNGGIAVFSPLAPIPESVSEDQQNLYEPAPQSKSFWRSLFVGILEQTPEITQAIWGPKQPAALPLPQSRTRPSVTTGAGTASPSILAVPSAGMCLNPAALTHTTTQTGAYVTSPNAPDSYTAYIPCSQVKK
jgi:hypothetical protein